MWLRHVHTMVYAPWTHLARLHGVTSPNVWNGAICIDSTLSASATIVSAKHNPMNENGDYMH